MPWLPGSAPRVQWPGTSGTRSKKWQKCGKNAEGTIELTISTWYHIYPYLAFFVPGKNGGSISLVPYLTCFLYLHHRTHKVVECCRNADLWWSMLPYFTPLWQNDQIFGDFPMRKPTPRPGPSAACDNLWIFRLVPRHDWQDCGDIWENGKTSEHRSKIPRWIELGFFEITKAIYSP